jgi:tripartite-type tricarboxylate transporter receptor subunit TctC
VKKYQYGAGLFFCALSFLFLSFLFSGITASAHQSESPDRYPSRPITIIIPFSKGGATDLLTRVVAEKMEKDLGQPLHTVNVIGNGGTVGVLEAAMAVADGYTLVVGNQGTHASAPALYGTSLQYDPERDFSPIGLVASTPLYVVVRKGLVDEDQNAITTFQQLVRYLRSYPYQLIIGHSGKGSTAHLAALYFMSLTKTKMVEMPYKGSAPALKDLTAGIFDVMCDQSASVIDYIRRGDVLPLLYAQKNRSMIVQDVPSAKEVGLPEYDLEGWNILFAPRDVPEPLIEKLNQSLNKALTDPDVIRQMTTLNALIRSSDLNTPKNMKEFITKEVRRWSSIVRVARVKGDDDDDD